MIDERDRTLADLDSDADDGPYAPDYDDERDCGCSTCRDSEGTWA